MIFASGVGGVATSVLVPQTVAAVPSCERRILSIPPWYRGLTDANCNIRSPVRSQGEAGAELSSFIWRIALNVVEIMLHIVGYAAVGFIIYGGFSYLTSTGQPDKIAGAKKTVMNAIIGLVISLFAIAIVNVVVGIF